MDTKQKSRTPDAKRSRTALSARPHKRQPGQNKPERAAAPEVVFMPPKPFSRNRLILRLATVAALVIALLFSVSVFFKVQNVEVSGVNKYDASSILEASGIHNGENLITLNRPGAAGKIMKALPYVKSVRIGIRLPDTVLISVEEVEVAYSVQARDGRWWMLSSDGKVLEEDPEGQRTGHTKILGLQIEVPEVGQTAVALEQPPKTDEEGNPLPVTVTAAKQLETALAVARQLELNHMIGVASSIDVTSVMDIVLWYGVRFQVELGDANALPKKIYSMKNVISNMDSYASGIIDLTDPDDPEGIPYRPF